MSLLEPTILDDRGCRVRLVPHEPFEHLRRTERSRRLTEAAQLPRGRPTRREYRRGVQYWILALPLLLAPALAPAFFTSVVRVPVWLLALIMLPLGAAPALLTIFIFRRVIRERVASTYVAAGYCGSCGYDLSAAPIESDGVRICSECGAAWGVARSAPSPDRGDRPPRG